METIKMYTNYKFTSNAGLEFTVYKKTNNVGEAVFLIHDASGLQVGYRKSKKSIQNFLTKN